MILHQTKLRNSIDTLLKYRQLIQQAGSDDLGKIIKFKQLTWADEKKGRTQCRRLPALCGVWGRVVFKPQALPTQMCGGWGSNPGPSGYRR